MDLAEKKETPKASNCSKDTFMNITSARFLMCIFIIVSLILIKMYNVYLYTSIKEFYLNQNAFQIINAENVKSYVLSFLSSMFSPVFDSFRTCIVNIFRSVTS